MSTYRLLGLAATIAVAACSNGSVGPPSQTSTNVASSSYSNLQFAVGTANLAGQIGLNAVVTLRQPNGLSAVGYSTPTITWDGSFTNANAPGQDNGTSQISGVLPVNPPGSGAAPASTFGSGAGSWGAFGYGFSNSNLVTTGPSTIAHPCLPFYGAFLPPASALYAGSPAATVRANDIANTGTSAWVNCQHGEPFFGGPPAFPNVRDAALAGEYGAFLGFTPFAALAPVPNGATGAATFSLSVAIPTSPVTTLPTVTSRMTAFGGLPTFATPTFTFDGTGGGTIAYTLPAGVTEAYLQVVDWGPNGDASAANCNFGTPPFFYTVLVKPGAANPIAIGDNNGPVPALGSLTTSTHTICTSADNTKAAGAATGGDQIQLTGIGFDYPAFEAAYPQSNGNAKPTIVGSNGQADITISDLSPLATSP